MTRKLSIEEARERIKESGKKIKILEYKRAGEKAKLKCTECGTIWDAVFTNIINRDGKGCPKCSNVSRGYKKALKYNDVRDYVEQTGCSLLSKEYFNNHENLSILYPCGHINKLTLNNFKRGFGCRKCWEKRSYADRYGSDEVIDILLDNGLRFIDFPNGYVSGQSKVRYSCNYGHVTERYIKYFIKFPTCKKCKIESRGISQRGENGNNWQGGITELNFIIRGRLNNWRMLSAKNCNYRCVITGSDVDLDVHHLYSFNLIVKEVLAKRGLDGNFKYSEMNPDDVEDIIKEVIDKHFSIGYGVCLKSSIHELFHIKYGYGNNTPEQFYDFVKKIKSGQIQIKNQK